MWGPTPGSLGISEIRRRDAGLLAESGGFPIIEGRMVIRVPGRSS